MQFPLWDFFFFFNNQPDFVFILKLLLEALSVWYQEGFRTREKMIKFTPKQLLVVHLTPIYSRVLS